VSPLARACDSIFSARLLTLNGWIAFNLPRTVTCVGCALLVGLVTTHLYLVLSRPALPFYFVAYAVALSVSGMALVGAMAIGVKPFVTQIGWYGGSMVCTAFLGIYLVSRWVKLPDLAALTGRWDIAPGTVAMALAAAFIAVHVTVLSGINVASPRRQIWHD
jgi:hypothetical protein